MDYQKEFDYIVDFIKQSEDLGSELVATQFHALWTLMNMTDASGSLPMRSSPMERPNIPKRNLRGFTMPYLNTLCKTSRK